MGLTVNRWAHGYVDENNPLFDEEYEDDDDERYPFIRGRDHLRLVQDAYNLIGKTVSALPESSVREMPLSCRVGEELLFRLCNDLRSASLLAARGYALQAATLVASIFETAFTIAYIGADEERAVAWREHTDPTRTFLPITRLLRDVLQDEPDEVGDLELRCYTQLCMAKHENPLLQRRRGVRETDTQIEVFIGPDTGASAVRFAWYALEHGVRLASIAARHFAQAHVAADRWPADEYDNLTAGFEQINASARARGWTEDPFPGSWRGLKK